MSADEFVSLAEVFTEARILVRPDEQSRTEVVKALVRQLVDIGTITQAQSSTVIRLINEREAMGSTAIGGGVALPHARVRFTDAAVGAFALLESGQDFNALDGAPVQYVFLVLTPKEQDALHVCFLKSITKFVKDPIHLKALAGCQTPAEVQGVFRDYA